MAMKLSSPIYTEHPFLYDKSITNIDAPAATYPLYGVFTPTTATLTPTRMKNIKQEFEEELQETSYIARHKPKQYQRQAGFVIPNVNYSLYMKPNKHLLEEYHLKQQKEQQQLIESLPPLELATFKNEFCSSNSDDSFRYSEGYFSDHTSSSNADNLSALSMSQTSKIAAKRSAKNQNMEHQTNEHPVTRSQTGSNNKRQPKKSGGRRPDRSEYLTPEEEAKRAKRRERNKQAAARCRKRRLDQTTSLMDETNEMAKENEDLIAKVKILAEEYQNIQSRLSLHESQCQQGFKLAAQMEHLDYEQLHELMQTIPDEGADLLDDTASVSSRTSTARCSSVTMPSMDHGDLSIDSVQFSSYDNNVGNSNITIVTATSSSSSNAKRRRPNTLPVSKSYHTTSVNNDTNTTNNSINPPSSLSTSTANQTDPSVITPTNGIHFDNSANSNFTLTPILNGPDWTPITPSTIARILG